MTPEAVNRGDRLRMTDLRAGRTDDVTVESVDADGKAIVRRDADGARFRVHVGFLTTRP